MAMLCLSDIMQRTWGEAPAALPGPFPVPPLTATSVLSLPREGGLLASASSAGAGGAAAGAGEALQGAASAVPPPAPADAAAVTSKRLADAASVPGAGATGGAAPATPPPGVGDAVAQREMTAAVQSTAQPSAGLGLGVRGVATQHQHDAAPASPSASSASAASASASLSFASSSASASAVDSEDLADGLPLPLYLKIGPTSNYASPLTVATLQGPPGAAAASAVAAADAAGAGQKVAAAAAGSLAMHASTDSGATAGSTSASSSTVGLTGVNTANVASRASDILSALHRKAGDDGHDSSSGVINAGTGGGSTGGSSDITAAAANAERFAAIEIDAAVGGPIGGAAAGGAAAGAAGGTDTVTRVLRTSDGAVHVVSRGPDDSALHPCPPGEEFWSVVLPPVKAARPDFLLLAEVYWGLEGTLRQLGFDATYDKVFRDTLLAGTAEAALGHLRAFPLAEHVRCARFVENHDEERAIAAFAGRCGGGIAASLAAAAITLATPCLRFLHDGQLEGRKAQHSVHVGESESSVCCSWKAACLCIDRRGGWPTKVDVTAVHPYSMTTAVLCFAISTHSAAGPRTPEAPHPDVLRFYECLLPLLAQREFKSGGWHLPMVTPSRDGNGSWRSLMAFFVTPGAASTAAVGPGPGIAAAPSAGSASGSAPQSGADGAALASAAPLAPLAPQKTFLLVVNYSGAAADGHVSFTRADDDGSNVCGRSDGALASQAYLSGWLTGLAAAGAAVAGAAAAAIAGTAAAAASSSAAMADAAGAAAAAAAAQGLCVTLVDRLAHPAPAGATAASAASSAAVGSAAATAALAEAQAQAQAQAQALCVSSSLTSYGKSSSPPLTESAFRYPVALLRREGLWLRLPPWGVRAYELLPELQ